MTGMSGGSGLHLAGKAEFLSASEATLINWIESARENITFLGAGLSLKLAQSLVCQKHLLAGGVILDNDQQVYQNGYGSVEAVRLLQANQVHLGQGRNLRLNILVCDQKALIYSPTPVVLEDAPTRQAPRASGLVIDAPAVLNLLASLVPLEAEAFAQAPALEELLPDQAGDESKRKAGINQAGDEGKQKAGLNQAGAPMPVTRLPVCKLTEPEIGRAEQAVAQHPPRLDLSKVLRVYKGKLQFVEETVTRICRLLYANVKRYPPDNLALFLRKDDGDKEKLEEYILGKLRQAVGNPQSYVTDMELRCIYKDVTLEMLEKDEFKKAVNETRLRKVFDKEDLVVIGLAAVYKKEEGQDLFDLGN